MNKNLYHMIQEDNKSVKLTNYNNYNNKVIHDGYISLNAKYFPTFFSTEEKGDYRQGWNHCLRAIYQQPLVDVAPIIHGHWIIHDDEYGRTEECSVCHVEGMMHSPYCYKCGAKMDETTSRNM